MKKKTTDRIYLYDFTDMETRLKHYRKKINVLIAQYNLIIKELERYKKVKTLKKLQLRETAYLNDTLKKALKRA